MDEAWPRRGRTLEEEEEEHEQGGEVEIFGLERQERRNKTRTCSSRFTNPAAGARGGTAAPFQKPVDGLARTRAADLLPDRARLPAYTRAID